MRSDELESFKDTLVFGEFPRSYISPTTNIDVNWLGKLENIAINKIRNSCYRKKIQFPNLKKTLNVEFVFVTIASRVDIEPVWIEHIYFYTHQH